MFKFLTALFLIIYTIKLFMKGGLGLRIMDEFYSFGYISKENMKERRSDENYLNSIIKIMLYAICSAMLFFIEIIYLLNAFQYDMLKYPTIAILTFSVASILLPAIKNKFSNSNLSEEERYNLSSVKNKKRLNSRFNAIKTKIIQFIHVLYWTYIVWIVFIK